MSATVVRTRRIALAFPEGVPHLARTLRGIHEYAREHRDWSLVISPEAHFPPVSSLKGWDGDGVVAMLNTDEDAAIARSLGMPVVNISGALEDAGLPRVRVNYRGVGELAAEHLLDNGFRRFAFYGLEGFWYSRQFGEGFADRVAEYGSECLMHESVPSIGADRPWQQGQAELESWISTLQAPVGLAAAHDSRARMVINACHRVGLHVPEDVAVIGMNNDTMTCEYCNPPLSSIERNGEKIGYQVAELLDRLIEGDDPPTEDIVIDPIGVVRRTSTNVIAVDDPQLAKAVRFVQENISEPFGVQALLQHTNVSRRWLEYAFQKWLRRTPHAFICEMRVAHAQKLLANSDDLSFSDVARACGFSSNKRLNVVFRRVTGKAPREYRDEQRQQTAQKR